MGVRRNLRRWHIWLGWVVGLPVLMWTLTGVVMVSKPIDGEPACRANGGTIGFTIDSPEQVDAWHRAGTENGGCSGTLNQSQTPRPKNAACGRYQTRSRFISCSSSA